MSEENGVTFDEILRYPYWRHRIDLEDGHFTPGTKPASDWNRLGLPESIDGMSVLDVGAFDGLLAFEAERRGAGDVLAIDIWSPDGNGEWWFGRKPRWEGFNLVREYLDSDVRGEVRDIYDVAPETIGQFDIVICSKVLPFLPEPYTAPSNLVSVTSDRVVVESATPRGGTNNNYPGLELASETTENPNRWWHPTPACLDALLRRAGCTSVEQSMVANTVRADDLRPGIVADETTAFRTPTLDISVDTIPSGSEVTVLYDYDGAVRVEYRPNPSSPYRQGWISEDAVFRPSTRTTTAHYFRRFQEIVREEGLSGVPSKVASFVKSQFGPADQNILAVGHV